VGGKKGGGGKGDHAIDYVRVHGTSFALRGPAGEQERGEREKEKRTYKKKKGGKKEGEEKRSDTDICRVAGA